MSDVSITYGQDLFLNIGPVPLVSVDTENVYENGEMHTVDTVTLSGRIRRTNCSEGGFSDPYEKLKLLASRLQRPVSKNLQITETISAVTRTVYSWDYAIVLSLSTDDNKWYDWIPYTIQFKCYKNGYFQTYGIIEPSREVSVENNPDGTLNLSISCSCKGLDSSSQAIVNARLFAYNNSAFVQADLDNLCWTSNILKTATAYLISEEETFNRLTGSVTIVRSYVLQDPSLGFSRGVLKYTREISTSDNGETTVTINGNHQGSFRDNTTDVAFEDDIKGKDWYSIAQDLYSYSVINDDPFKSINRFAEGRTGSSSDKLIFSTKTHGTSTYVRSPDCWLSSLDLTGISVWNSSGGNSNGNVDTGAGTAISPRHIVFAHHYLIADGATMRWVTKDNQVITRTLVTSQQVGATDIRIGILDSDLPDSICFYKVLPEGWGSTKLGTGLWCVSTDQEEKIMAYQFNDGTYLGAAPVFGPPSTSPLILLTETIIPGDSGNPAFLVLNNELVIMGALNTGATCPHLSYFLTSVNSVMTSLGGGYTLTEIDEDLLSVAPLFTSPVNFSFQRNTKSNSLSFSIEYSNQKNNDIYIVDETRIITDNETSKKCIEVSVSIRSDLKSQSQRWAAVVDYYSTFDFQAYVQEKWEKFGNTETLNFNTKQGQSYSENEFQGTIDVSASYCVDQGQSCGCLQDFNYQYSFVPPLKEYKISIPKEAQGCHYIEDLLIYKRASFSIRGNVISSLCCSYDKTVLELKNRLNQISNSLFFGERKVLDSVEVSKNNSGGVISFEASWSAKKDPFIPDELL